MSNRVVAVVQARMSSTRLPGKVLAELEGVPAIVFLLRRLEHARELDGIAVATSTDRTDDTLAEVIRDSGHLLVRGSLGDVLDRYRVAARELGADAIVRVTGDCPLVDPDTVDLLTHRWRIGGEDYVSSTLPPRTYPDGLDVEVISRSALVAAAAEATDPEQREHVTPYIHTNPGRFSQVRAWLDPPYGDVRITLDTPQDLGRLRSLIAQIGPDAGLNDILEGLGLPTARASTD